MASHFFGFSGPKGTVVADCASQQFGRAADLELSSSARVVLLEAKGIDRRNDKEVVHQGEGDQIRHYLRIQEPGFHANLDPYWRGWALYTLPKEGSWGCTAWNRYPESCDLFCPQELYRSHRGGFSHIGLPLGRSTGCFFQHFGKNKDPRPCYSSNVHRIDTSTFEPLLDCMDSGIVGLSFDEIIALKAYAADRRQNSDDPRAQRNYLNVHRLATRLGKLYRASEPEVSDNEAEQPTDRFGSRPMVVVT